MEDALDIAAAASDRQHAADIRSVQCLFGIIKRIKNMFAYTTPMKAPDSLETPYFLISFEIMNWLAFLLYPCGSSREVKLGFVRRTSEESAVWKI